MLAIAQQRFDPGGLDRLGQVRIEAGVACAALVLLLTPAGRSLWYNPAPNWISQSVVGVRLPIQRIYYLLFSTA
ncbi:MAG: hypothetical protein ACREFP_21130 [Acetobacteraceae bacterium]